MPARIQLSRRRGWRLPPNAVIVDRRSPWGNPFRVTSETNAAESVLAFEAWMKMTVPGQKLTQAAKERLRGKNLACWCRLGEPCHGEILLRIANEP